VFDYIPFPVFTHTTGMTHFQVKGYFSSNITLFKILRSLTLPNTASLTTAIFMTEHAKCSCSNDDNFLHSFHRESYRILTMYHECQHITDIQLTAANIHHTEIANHYQRFTLTVISKSKRKLTAFQN